MKKFEEHKKAFLEIKDILTENMVRRTQQGRSPRNIKGRSKSIIQAVQRLRRCKPSGCLFGGFTLFRPQKEKGVDWEPIKPDKAGSGKPAEKPLFYKEAKTL